MFASTYSGDVADHRARLDVPYSRLAVASALWTGVLAASFPMYDRAVEIGGTMYWLAVLHPVLFGLTVWPVLRSYWRERTWYRVSNAVLVLIYLYMGLGSANYIFIYDTLDPSTLKQAQHAGEGMWLVLLGTIAYRVGAEGPWLNGLIRRLPAMPATPRWSSAVSTGIAMAVLLSLAIALLQMSVGGFGYVVGGPSQPSYFSALLYLSDVGLIALTAGFFFWFAGAPMRTTQKALLVASFMLLLGLALLQGVKQEVVMVLVYSATPYLVLRSYGRARVTPPPWVTVVIPAVIVVTFALTPLYRDALIAGGASTNRLQAVAETIDALESRQDSEMSEDNVVVSGLENLVGRVTLFGEYLLTLDKTPRRYDHLNWDRYPTIAFSAVVPRSIWPDKPIHDVGDAFHRQYIESDSGSSSTPTVFGWSYIEDGAVGIVVLLFVLGLCASFVHRYSLGKHGVSLAAVIVVVCGYRALLNVENDPFWLFNGLPKDAATCAAGYLMTITVPRWVLSRT